MPLRNTSRSSQYVVMMPPLVSVMSAGAMPSAMCVAPPADGELSTV